MNREVISSRIDGIALDVEKLKFFLRAANTLDMYIIPIGNNFFLRLFTAAKVIFTQQAHRSVSQFLFRTQKCSAIEKTVLRLSQRLPLSTAEVIRCVEMGVQKLPNGDCLMDSVYADRDTTSDNIAALVKPADATRDVITAVANLYLRQQIIFDRV